MYQKLHDTITIAAAQSLISKYNSLDSIGIVAKIDYILRKGFKIVISDSMNHCLILRENFLPVDNRDLNKNNQTLIGK